MKPFLPKFGICTVFFIIVNLFFIDEAIGQTTTLFLQNTATQSGTTTSGLPVKDLSSLQGSSGTITSQGTTSGIFSETLAFTITNNAPVLAISGNPFVLSVNVGAVSSSNLEARFRMQRVNSAGVVQSSTGYSAIFNSVGLKTATLSFSPAQAWSLNDRLRLSIEVRQSSGNSSRTITVNTGNVNSYVRYNCTTPTAYNITGGGSYCAGGAGLAVGLSNSQADVNYQLYRDAIAVGSPLSGTGSVLSFGNQTEIGTYTVVANNSIGGTCTINMTGNAIISVNPLPTANAGSPLSSICQGGTSAQLGGSIGGSATGGTWSDGGVGGTFNPNNTDLLHATWTPPSGYNGTATLTLTTSGGLCGTTTATKSQVVNAPPTASVTPPISPATVNKSICSSQTATVEALEATASIGDNILWTIDQTTLYTGEGSITNSDSLTPTYHPAVADEGHTVTLKMTVSNSCIATASAYYTIAVNGTARVDAGGDQIICVTSPVVSLGGSIDGSAYRGTWSGGDGTIVQDPLNDYNMQIANSNYPTYTPSLTEISNGGDVILTLTTTDDSFGSPCGVSVTDTMKITILKETTAQTGVGGLPTTKTICSTDSATVSGASASVGDTILWSIDETTAYTGQGSITNESTLTPTYTSVAGDSGHTVTLKMTVSNAACPSATAYYTVVVNPLPINRNLIGPAPICSGSTAIVQVDNSEFGIQYQLRNNSDNNPTGAPVSGNGGVIELHTNPLSNTTAVATSVIVNVLATNLNTNCLRQMDDLVTISVNPEPRNRTFAAGTSPICAGTGTNITAVSIVATPLTTYELRKSTDLNTVISTVSGNTGGAINSPSFPTGNLTTTTTFDVLARIESTGCTARMTPTPTVTVNPVIANNTISADQNICTGTTPAILVGSTPTGGSGSGSYVYLWQQSTDNFSSNIDPANTANGSNTARNYTPPSNLSLTMWYRRRVISGPCTDFSIPVKITVNSLPTVYAVTGGGAFCYGSPGVSIGLSNSQLNVKYILFLNGSLEGSEVLGTGAAISFGDKTAAGTYTVNATDELASGNTNCSSSMSGSATIVVSPVPVAVGASICVEGSGVLTSSTVCPREAPQNTVATNANSATSIGEVAWTNPANIISDNGSNATVSNSTSTAITSGSLQASNYDFVIPPDAEIRGITVNINRNYSGSAIGSAQDNSVRLIKAGAILGSDKAVSGNWGTAAGTVVTYGGNSDLWGESWTPADINNPNFGVALKVNVVGGFTAGNANVDYMQITVTYAVNGSLKWYTVSTGGSSIGTGSPFNPVGVAGSGLPDTNTPGTTTYYVECSSVAGCRTPVNFVINPKPVVNCPSNQIVCIDTAPYPLTGASQTGGAYSGAGVSANNFDPATAGLGIHTITYSYTDSNGCSNTCTFTITVNPAVTVSGTQTNVLCNGASTGAIDLTVTGGSGSYTYLWSNGATTQDIIGLAASATPYSVTITELNGCAVTGTTSFTITESAPVFASGTQVNVLCKGTLTGSIDLTVTGGSGLYTYLWSNGETTQDINGLAAGTYSVTIFESNGCPITGTTSFTINQPTDPLETSITASTNVDCFGNNTGSATVLATGGTPGYTYLWKDGNGNSIGQTTATAVNLVAGDYSVTITDEGGNGCVSIENVTITEPVVLAATITGQTNVACFGGNTGSATVGVTGGTESYQYLWDDASAQTNATASGLEAGEYIVTITDVNGCITTATVTITESAEVVASGIQTNVLCNGASTGAIDLTVTGGSGSYTYEWSNGALTQDISNLAASVTPYSVIISESNGCAISGDISFTITESAAVVASGTKEDVLCKGALTGSIDLTVTGGSGSYNYEWNDGITTADRSGLAAGTYSVTITESNGCPITGTTSFTINEPADSLATSITDSTNVDCFGNSTGSATVVATGGTSPYTYLWNDGDLQTTETATDLVAGDYSVTVTDANGCSSTATVTITEPEVLAASIASQINVGCFGASTGSATVGVTGGTEPYEYLWNDTTAQTTATANGLGVGDYMVTVTDANGCITAATVTITQSNATEATGTQVNVSCKEGTDGSINLSVSGGSGSYTYDWSNGATTEDISGLTAGTYSVTVTDTGGCAVAGTTSFTITEPAVVFASGTQEDVLCKNGATGSIDLTVTGGSGSYTYLWSNGATSQDISGLEAGTYTVAITESKSCTVTGTTSFTIIEPTLLTAAITAQTDVDCFDNSNGSATVTAYGGTPPYTYSWVNGSALDAASGLGAGNYLVTVTDNNGCTATATAHIITDDNELPTVITQNIEVELNTTSVSITVPQINNGSYDNCGIQSITLSPSSFTCANVGPNTVTLTVTDTNGNVNSATATVTVKDLIMPEIIGMPANKTVSLSGGNCSALVKWTAPTATDNCGIESLLSSDATFNENGSTLLTAGVHTITYTATDVNGNSTTASFTVTVLDQIAPTITNCPANITVNNDSNICGARVFYIQPNVNDCNGATLNINNNNYLSGNIFPVGTTTVEWTASDASSNVATCSFTVTVIDNQAPVPNVASLPTVTGECSVTATAPTALDNCSGTIIGVPNGATTFSSPGNHTIIWTYTDSNGKSSSQSQTVTVNATPPVINTQPISLSKCEGQSAIFSVSAAADAIGYQWQLYDGSNWDDLASETNSTLSIASVTPGMDGNKYRVIVNGTCGSIPSSEVTLSVYSLPIASNQPNQEQCSTSTFNMTQSDPSVGTGLWSLVSGSATITTPSSPTTTVTGVAAGASATVRWTITNGACSAFDEVTVVNSVLPSVSNQTNQTLCSTSDFTMTQSAPTLGTGVWSLISGSAIITAENSPTTTITGVGAGESATVRWTVTNGSCSAFDEVTVTNTILPIVRDQVNQNLCNISSFTMTQSDPSVGTGSWSLISGIATITTPSSPTTTITGVAVGTSAKIRWTVTNGSCSAYDDVMVTNTILPSVSNQPDQSLCNTSSFTMTQSIPSAGTGVWTLINGSGIITTPNSPTTTVTGVTTSATLRWTVSNVDCSSYDDVIVTNSVLDPVSDQINQTLCNTSSFTMTQSAPSFGNGTWSLINGSANITSLSSPTTTITGVAVGTSATVRWTVSSGSCSAYDDVTVSNTAAPSVSNQPDQTLCNTSSFTMTQTGSGTWSLINGSAVITTPSSPTTTITGVGVGTSATVRWTAGSGSCTAFDDVIVTNNNAAPTVSNQPNQPLCNTSSFTMTQTGSGTWSLVSGSAVITAPSSPTTTITGVAVGTSATVRWTVGSGSCTAYDDVTVTNNAGSSFTASIASSSPDAFCSGLVLTANPSVAGSYSYLWSPGGATTASITLNNSSSAGIYTVTVTQSGGCGGSAQATYNFQPQNVINDYTILGFTDVNLGDRNFVQTGSVGVTRPLGLAVIGTNSTVAGPGAFVKARFITVPATSNVPARVYSAATVVLPSMQVNSTSTTGLADLTIPNNTTVTKVGNYKNVTIGTNCNVTFTTGTIFGTVTIGRSSQVKFNANNTGVLNVNSISMADGTDASPTKLLFASNIAVRVKTTVSIGKSSLVNPTGGYKAVFFIGGNEFRVLTGGNVTVNASIFAPNGTIRVEGDAVKNTFMKGFNIASRVVSTNKNVYWNQFDCANPSAKTTGVENIVAKEIDPVRPEVALFDVKAYPNPSDYQFTLELLGGSADKIEVEVYDMQGRHIKHIESEYDVPIVFGEELPAGTYLTIVNQGSNRKALKLIKK